ncbi:hypothetical protein [Nonomuraea basaltis]|uniref:hypothetical protein n=1 Tax=Nonomuraea basaltis TaxID=2495887 RepID=UPI00110C5BD5|nr:hypothetical protein [Nonomuraea basaltis]TMR99585.1 hypothetical protein EJK15_07160 [Nonomuraea basaltis]
MNPHTLEARARMAHWQITLDGRALVLTRDDWTIRVLFDGSAPAKAVIRKPGSSDWQHLDRRAITTHVRGHREQMTMFRLGDRVKVGDRYGAVTDVHVETPTALTSRACPVRLVVAYADGDPGTPYVTSVLRLPMPLRSA